MSKFLNISTDTTLGGNSASDEVVSSQKAIKAYVDSHGGGGGGSYTAGTGIDITNDVISVTSPTLTNTATGTGSLTILGTAVVGQQSVNIGSGSKAGRASVVIGYNATCASLGSYNVAVGYNSEASANIGYSVALGNEAKTSAKYAIQLGYGTNSEANSFYVSTSNYNNWKMLGNDGLIPDARISSNIARTTDIPAPVTETTVSGWGFTKNAGTVTSVNNSSPDSNGNVSLTIPTVDQTYSASSTNAQSGTAVAGALAGKADTDLSNLTSTGKSYASGLGMPSSRYIDLTLGASGANYTAPANGCFFISAKTSGNDYQIRMVYIDGVLAVSNRSNSLQTDLILPAEKGRTAVVNYDGSLTNVTFRFIYAQGEN